MKRILTLFISCLLSTAVFAGEKESSVPLPPAPPKGLILPPTGMSLPPVPQTPSYTRATDAADGFYHIDSFEWGKVTLSNGSKATLLKKNKKFHSGDVFICGDKFIRWQWKGKEAEFPVDTRFKNKPLTHSPGITVTAIENALRHLNSFKKEGRTLTLYVSMGVEGELPMVSPLVRYPGITIRQKLSNKKLFNEFNRKNNGRDTVSAILLHTTC